MSKPAKEKKAGESQPKKKKERNEEGGEVK